MQPRYRAACLARPSVSPPPPAASRGWLPAPFCPAMHMVTTAEFPVRWTSRAAAAPQRASPRPGARSGAPPLACERCCPVPALWWTTVLHSSHSPRDSLPTGSAKTTPLRLFPPQTQATASIEGPRQDAGSAGPHCTQPGLPLLHRYYHSRIHQRCEPWPAGL